VTDYKQILHNISVARRRELIPLVYHYTSGQVQSGPFKDMTILPYYMWGDGDTPGKLLGVYEDELHPYIQQIIDCIPDVVINVGCAEGYYAVGLAGRTNARVYAADIETTAQNICKANANANSVVIETHGRATPETLTEMIAEYHTPVIISDCEGYEDELLDITACPNLAKCRILVETHDIVFPGITNRIAERFSKTHDVTIIKQTGKDAHKFAILDKISDTDKLCLINEGRPISSYWLWMVPKA
jgi:hypothetical protein